MSSPSGISVSLSGTVSTSEYDRLFELNRADARNRLGSGSLLATVESALAFRFGEDDLVMFVFLAKSSIVCRVFVNASTASSIAQLLRSFISCSAALHIGHLPSLESALRIQSEQKVCEQEVIMGVL
jgi:hypothetical protein